MPTGYDERQIAPARWVIDRSDAGEAGPRRPTVDLEWLSNSMDDQDLGCRIREA